MHGKAWAKLYAIILPVVAAFLLLASGSTVQAQINVVTTIKPLQFIAAAITGNRGDVTSIMDQRDSAHHFALSPSDRLQLADAILIIRVGPELEIQLSTLLGRAEFRERVINVTELAGMRLHELQDGTTDPHVWLDPVNGERIAEAIQRRLAALDQANAEYYLQNLQVFRQQLSESVSKIEQLTAEASPRYIVYHDAFQYFERRFGFSHLTTLVNDPESQPTMRALLSKRGELSRLDPSCLFMEPDANVELIATLLQDHDPIRLLPVDLLGFAIEPSVRAYSTLLEGVTNTFLACEQAVIEQF